MFCIINCLFLFGILNSIRAEFANDAIYTDLIAKANLYYIHPTITDPLKETVISELKNSFIWKSQDIKIVIHGWYGGRNHISVNPIKYSYLRRKHDALFMADWTDASRIIYFDARYFVQPVALKLAKLLEEFINYAFNYLNSLRKNNIDPGKLHIIGHSLGAHISGNIGNYFNGTIGRITGLDPAGPLFESYVKDGLHLNHAKLVDCIHTCSPILGQSIPRGHVDFYPNYGIASQPGCEILDLITATACSHLKAVLYFAESIIYRKNFPSISCSLKNILKTQCLSNKTESIVYMGDKISKSAEGTYFLLTKATYPYGTRFPALNKKNKNMKSKIITTPIRYLRQTNRQNLSEETNELSTISENDDINKNDVSKNILVTKPIDDNTSISLTSESGQYSIEANDISSNSTQISKQN